MAKISEATRESVESVMELTARVFPTAEARFQFWKSLADVLNVDGQGRVSFRPILVAERRRAVGELFDGANTQAVAQHLSIPVATVRNDLEAIREK